MLFYNATFVNDNYNITSSSVAKFSMPLHFWRSAERGQKEMGVSLSVNKGFE